MALASRGPPMNGSQRELLLRLAEAEQANNRKSAFLTNVSHDLRTPSREQRDYLSTIQDLSALLLKITNDILDLCKIEAGKMSLDPVPSTFAKSSRTPSSLFPTRRAKRV